MPLAFDGNAGFVSGSPGHEVCFLAGLKNAQHMARQRPTNENTA